MVLGISNGAIGDYLIWLVDHARPVSPPPNPNPQPPTPLLPHTHGHM